MLRILIIEDEIPNAQQLERMLRSMEDCQVMGPAQTVRSAVEILNSEDPVPDIIFMDIKLTDGMSFEIFEKVSIQSPVIFLTAYDQYAIKAFEVNAIDYLLKPIVPEKLRLSLEKAKRFLGKSPDDALLRLLRRLREQETQYRQRFLVAYRDRLLPVTTKEIAYFYSENKVTHIVTLAHQDYILEETLEQLEAELDPAVFMRVTRRCIVHQNAIQTIYQLFNGQVGIELKPPFKDKIHLSRQKSNVLKQWLGQ